MHLIMTLLYTALLLLAGPTPAEAQQQELTIVSWGGAYSRAQLRAYHQPYTAMTGVNIINDDGAVQSVARLRAMNETGNITWDVVDIVASDAIRLCDEGLALTINADQQLQAAPDGTPASADFGDKLVSDCLIPQLVYSTAFGYRTDLVGDKPPSKICDVFDLETWPGRRALAKYPMNNMEWALLCDGVAKDDLYKVLATGAGQERALAKLDSIKPHVIWWTAGSDTPQLLADGEIVIGSGYNGRLFSVIEEEQQPVAILWDAQVLDFGGWIIPAGLGKERTQRALDFVRFSNGAQRMADISKYISYAPVRNSALPLVGKHADLGINMAPHMPTTPENARNVIVYNYEFWSDHRDDIEERFHVWLAK
ncbi:MAG: extracellular solute-binding protein [Gammaproteobacteria bacterium]